MSNWWQDTLLCTADVITSTLLPYVFSIVFNLNVYGLQTGFYSIGWDYEKRAKQKIATYANITASSHLEISENLHPETLANKLHKAIKIKSLVGYDIWTI